MATLQQLIASRGARKPFEAALTPRRKTRRKTSPEVRLARRALRLLSRISPATTYVVTDIQVGASTPRRLDVVYVEQRVLGLPVYGARRSVAFVGRRTYVTGRPWAATLPPRLTPTITPEEAATRAARTLGARRRALVTRLLSAGPGPERTSVVLIERDVRATLHLAAYGRRRRRLVWVVRLTMSNGDAFEVLIDAVSGDTVRRRPLADHAAACLLIDELAGGPGPAAPTATLTFDRAWIDGAARSFQCIDGHDRPRPPQPNASGDFCATKPAAFDQLAAHALAFANLGLKRLVSAGALWPRRADIKIVHQASTVADDVAFAVPSAERPMVQVGFSSRSSPARHAASDPCVLLHEIGHLVLCAGIGGGNVVAPFEPDGESAAVNEGLADYLGLTLWNAIRGDARIAGGEFMNFGGWVFAGRGRNYAPFLGPGASVPPAGSTPHARGMSLCVALLRTRIELQSSMSTAAADAVMWRCLVDGLRLMPHEGGLPELCCAAKSLQLAIPSEHHAILSHELTRVTLARPCPHLTSA